MKKVLLISTTSALIDQIIKLIIISNIQIGNKIIIIKNFFSITFLGNTGAAFSSFNSNTKLLIIISFFALGFIYYFFIRKQTLNKFQIITYGLLIGGIIGNLIDRIIRGYVIDYLDFNILGYNYPVFNLADTFIVISIILITFQTLKGETNANRSKR